MTEQVQNHEQAAPPYGQMLKLFTQSGLAVLKNRGGVRLGNGVSRARPVQSDAVLPQEADAVVIGGGNIGCLTALTLAERGLKVVLCEKGAVAGESSGRSLGYIESLFADPVKLEMAARAKQQWQDMHTRVHGPTGYVKTGSVTGFLSEEGLAAAAGWLDAVKGMPGIDGQILTQSELKEKTAGWREDFVGGLY
ncbi:MAG: NAD(P)/FAD-dependent oxidoreductase, partial [Acinetobacter sp.]